MAFRFLEKRKWFRFVKQRGTIHGPSSIIPYEIDYVKLRGLSKTIYNHAGLNDIKRHSVGDYEFTTEQSGNGNIFIPAYPLFYRRLSYLVHAIATMGAMQEIDLEGKVCVDIGCGPLAMLTMLALKKGAGQVLMVENHKGYFRKAAAPLRENSFSPERYLMLQGDFRDYLADIAKASPVLLINMGPSYREVMQDPHMELIRSLPPQIDTVVNGGFQSSELGALDPDEYIDAYLQKGFQDIKMYRMQFYGEVIAFTASR